MPPGSPPCPYGGIGSSLSMEGGRLVAASNYFDPIAFVYERTGGAWRQQFALDASPYLGRNGTSNRVASSGTTVVIGARRAGSSGGIAIYDLPE